MSAAACRLDDKCKIPPKIAPASGGKCDRDATGAYLLRTNILFKKELLPKTSFAPSAALHIKPFLNAEWQGPEATTNPSRAAGPGLRIELSLLTAALTEPGTTSVPASRCPCPKWTSLGLCFATTLHTRLRSVKCQWRLNNSSAGGNPTPRSSSGTVQPINSRYFSKLQSRLDVHFFFFLLFSLFVHF